MTDFSQIAGRSFSYLYSTVTEFKKKKLIHSLLLTLRMTAYRLLNTDTGCVLSYWLISKAETCVSAAGVMDILVYLYISLLIFFCTKYLRYS